MDGKFVVDGGSLEVTMHGKYADRPEGLVVGLPGGPAAIAWPWCWHGLSIVYIVRVCAVVAIFYVHANVALDDAYHAGSFGDDSSERQNAVCEHVDVWLEVRPPTCCY